MISAVLGQKTSGHTAARTLHFPEPCGASTHCRTAKAQQIAAFTEICPTEVLATEIYGHRLQIYTEQTPEAQPGSTWRAIKWPGQRSCSPESPSVVTNSGASLITFIQPPHQ